MPDEDTEKEGKEQHADARETFFQVLEDFKQEAMAPPENEMDIPSDPKGQTRDSGEDKLKELSEKTSSSKSARPGDANESETEAYRNHQTARNIKIIMKVLEGSFQRSTASKASHPGGMPRRWKRMNIFELEDSDPLEFSLWSANSSPNLPRIQLREKNSTGGEIAILRDVSTSMMGIYSEWASSVVRGVAEIAKTKNMRVGYLEFNHKADPYGRRKNRRGFFTREYQWLFDAAGSTDCSGNTNYEEALKNAVAEFKGRGRRNKHILFITDGIPTSGDISFGDDEPATEIPPQREKRQLVEYLNAGAPHRTRNEWKEPRPLRDTVRKTQRLGICIHSIFIGSKNYPKILRRISEDTGGTQFVTFRDKKGIMQVERRDRSERSGADRKHMDNSFDPVKAHFQGPRSSA